MNKLLVICGGDRLGKGTLIKGLCEHYDYKNVTIRHCDKPPKNILKNEVLNYQLKVFEQEFELIKRIQMMNRKFMYHDNIIIYDRFYNGEYVYGQLFRNYDAKLIKNSILSLEEKYLKPILRYSKVHLITLTAVPKFFQSKEDGNSFSDTLEDKTRELELFKEAHDFSIISNKLLLKVDVKEQCLRNDRHENRRNLTYENNFRPKQEILSEVLEFINN